jgi:hypothetical protein
MLDATYEINVQVAIEDWLLL